MWIYLWDLVDEGHEKVLRNLSENGLTSISLATAYHAGKFLAPHNPKRKVVFLEDGTVYFRPDPKMYGRIHPRINSLVKAGHGLEKAKKAADKFSFKTRAWVVCCHNTPLGMKYPDIASESAFGDKLYHNLCPSNDDVRRYIRSLVSDIASHGVDAIELEALQFQGYAHGYHHEREGIELNSAARFLWGFVSVRHASKEPDPLDWISHRFVASQSTRLRHGSLIQLRLQKNTQPLTSCRRMCSIPCLNGGNLLSPRLSKKSRKEGEAAS